MRRSLSLLRHFSSLAQGGRRTQQFSNFNLLQETRNLERLSLRRWTSTRSTATSAPAPQPRLEEEEIVSSSKFEQPSDQGTATVKMGGDDDKALKHYILPLDQPVVSLDCTEAFNGLSEEEKKYSHYLSQASWVGGLVVLVQTSPEAPVIFSLLHDLFKTNGVEGLKCLAINDCSFSEDEWKALTVYTSGLFACMGNYKSFGDTKFIPGVPSDKLGQLMSKAKFSMCPEDVQEKWEYVKDRVYSLSDREKQLGLGEKGVTTYFSKNCTKEDAELVMRFLKDQKLEAWNTRCFKKTEGTATFYEIRSAAKEVGDVVPKEFAFEGATFKLTKGDYSPLMAKTNEYLAKALENVPSDGAGKDHEAKMLENYIKCFQTGDVNFHKEGSRHWIKDKGPVIETYIGFIENYRDPAGVRAEFEGFVAVVNKETSKKYGKLVEHATDYLKKLPWTQEFEKDKFLKPDFTSLDVLAFAGSGIPAGINIPNYDEIRQTEGFKNVSLGNVIPASYKDSTIPFLTAEDKELLDKYRIPSFGVQVALHELLGHGSGKLFKKNKDGTLNYSPDLKNPLTKQIIESCYNDNETYDSVFGDMGSAFEECRAECVGLHLSLELDILRDIFGYEGEEAKTVAYVNWLNMVWAGAAKTLEMYQPSTKAWMQAHSQARFSILQVLLEAGDGLVEMEQIVGADGKPDLVIHLDKDKIWTVGRKAIADYLLKIQVYKATADVKAARAMFDGYTAVHDEGKYPWASWRDIVMDKKQPRKYFVQHNTVLEGNNVTLKTYPATPEGVIESWVDKFHDTCAIYKALDYSWNKDKEHF